MMMVMMIVLMVVIMMITMIMIKMIRRGGRIKKRKGTRKLMSRRRK